MSEIRNLNTFTLGAGFNITSGEPIDSRQYVKSIEQIYDPNNWIKVKPYNSLLVIAEDGQARICIDAANYQSEDAWIKVGGDTTVVNEIQQNITNITTKLDTVETNAQENKIEEIQVNGNPLSIAGKSVNIDLSEYAKSSDVASKEDYDQKVSEIEGELSNKVAQSDFDALSEVVGNPASGEAEASGLYKVIADAESALRDELSSIPKFAIEVVDELPSEGISDTTIYLVKDKEGNGDLYTEFIYVNNAWENLGKQTVDLSSYSTTEEMNSAIAEAVAKCYSKDEVNELLNNKVAVEEFESYKGEVDGKLNEKANASDLDNYQTTEQAQADHQGLVDQIEAVDEKAQANELAIAEFKVKNVDSTESAGVSLDLDESGNVKAKVNSESLASNLVGAAGSVGPMSGSNLKLGVAITSTEEVDGEQSTETIIEAGATVAEAIQSLSGQIQSAVAGGISGISGDEFIKVSGSTTSKSLTLEVAKVTEKVANDLISENSAIQKDENGKLHLTWSSL